jgi:hypothetical protein
MTTGTPGRTGRAGWRGCAAADVPGTGLDIGLRCVRLGGSAELCGVPHCTPVPVPGCSVHVWAVHPGTDSSTWQLSWLRHVCLDLWYLLWRVRSVPTHILHVSLNHLIWIIQYVTLKNLRYQGKCFFMSFSVLLFTSYDYISKEGFMGNKMEETRNM